MALQSVISNFKKKNCSIVNKRLFPQKFSKFPWKNELCKKYNLKAIPSNQVPF